ncbi:MAG: hypothetical protein IJW55_00715 [Clostridia bacterium]|nr:hypothetical protein [Clostridia bacterium]
MEQRTNIPMPSENYRTRHRHSHDAKTENGLKVLKGCGETFSKVSPQKNKKLPRKNDKKGLTNISYYDIMYSNENPKKEGIF